MGIKKRRSFECMKYDVIIVGAGPGGIYSAYELTKKCGGKKSRFLIPATP